MNLSQLNIIDNTMKPISLPKRLPSSSRGGLIIHSALKDRPTMVPLGPKDSANHVSKSSQTKSLSLNAPPTPLPPQQQKPALADKVPMVYSPPPSFYQNTSNPPQQQQNQPIQKPSPDSFSFSKSQMVAGFFEDQEEEDSLTMLPAKASQFSWAREDYSSSQRTIETWSFVLSLRARTYLLDAKWSYPGGMTDGKKSVRSRALGIWLRERLLSLGPTFIKVGQLFSTRSDLLAPEFTEELSKLQDRVPAFETTVALQIIERELGGPVDQLFAEFDPSPLAAASLGQVHRARLFTGEQVVVKIQRPGLKRLFDIDLDNLRDIANFLDKGEEAERVGSDFVGIYNECARILMEEIDYINEGKNADRFRRNFATIPWVKVPKVYWNLSSPAILTLEYLPGIKITKSGKINNSNSSGVVKSGLDGSAIAKRATEAYLLQILRYGFFHADPHPGNIAVDPITGSLIFYDFGMMGEIVPATRGLLADLARGIANKDANVVLQCLVELGILVPTGDRTSLKNALTFFLDNINKQVERNETVATIGEDLFSIALDSPFRFPAAFTFVLRAFATLEGIGKSLDPKFSFGTVAAPYASELLQLGDASQQQQFALEQLSSQATQFGTAAAAMPLRVEKMESTLTQLESGDIRLRVRVLEAERSARRAGVMQLVTLNTVACVGLLNVGTQLCLNDKSTLGGAVLLLSSVFAGSMILGMRRVKRLDGFENDIKGRTRATKSTSGEKK